MLCLAQRERWCKQSSIEPSSQLDNDEAPVGGGEILCFKVMMVRRILGRCPPLAAHRVGSASVAGKAPDSCTNACSGRAKPLWDYGEWV